MKLRSALVSQPGLKVDPPWKFARYHTALTGEWELEATGVGVVARRDGGAWLVPWNRVMGCEVEPEAAAVAPVTPLTASVGAVVKAGKR